MSTYREQTNITCRVELLAGLLVTVLLVWLHVEFMWNAGAFWRDEVHTIHLATLPSMAEVWSYMYFDSFPVLSVALIRLWSGLGLAGTELGLRFFGLLVGFSIIGALWYNARLFGHRTPTISLILFGLSSLVIRVGDSIRPYGLGVFLSIVTFGLIWRVVDSPTPRRIIAATVVSVLSVQALYTNALLLFAFCLGGVVVTLCSGMWKRAAILVGIGVVAALSLLPYIGMIRGSGDWVILLKSPHTFKQSWDVLWGSALGSASPLIPWIWAFLFLFGILVAAYRIIRGSGEEASTKRRETSLFSLTVMVVTPLIFFVFYKVMQVNIPPWYFLYPMAIVAVSLDTIFGNTTFCGITDDKSKSVWGLCRVLLIILVVGLTLTALRQKVNIRQTNVDFIATELAKKVSKEDLVLVNPWFAGITFQRYYKGTASWMTIPPLEDLRIHRFDLLKEKMSNRYPMQQVFSGIEETLKRGGTLWLVGDFYNRYRHREGMVPKVLAPAPYESYGWKSGPYRQSWLIQTEYFIHSNARQYERLPLKQYGSVNPYERLFVVTAIGWRY